MAASIIASQIAIQNIARQKAFIRKSTVVAKETGLLKEPSCSASIQATSTHHLPSLPIEKQQQHKSSSDVDIVVGACLRYFSANATNCVGLFRVPGEHDHVQTIWQYMQDHPGARSSVNCVEVFMRNHPEFTAHDVSSFLKRFIKSICGNKPVITYDCWEPLVNLIREKCPADLIAKKYRQILGQLLVPARRLLLECLCKFLLNFSSHKDTTNMGCANLAVCFANLLQPPPEDDSHSSLDQVGKKTRKNPRKFKFKKENPSSRSGKKRNSKRRSKFNKRSSKRRSKIAHSRSASEISAFVKAEGEKTKLCVSAIEILIKESHHVFRKQRMPSPLHTNKNIYRQHSYP